MKNRSRKILIAGLIVGSLDILSAFIYYFIRTGKPDVFVVLRYIASGVFGKKAYAEGPAMVLAGLLFHFIIAFAFTILFFPLYNAVSFMRRHVIVSGILYGVFVWCVMNLVIVPLSMIGKRPMEFTNALIGMIILIICIGIPLSLMADRFQKAIRQSV